MKHYEAASLAATELLRLQRWVTSDAKWTISSNKEQQRKFMCKCYLLSAGVGALRRVYGSNKRRGVTPNHFARASGSVIRKALQTLEAIKWVEKHPDGNGRILTKQVGCQHCCFFFY